MSNDGSRMIFPDLINKSRTSATLRHKSFVIEEPELSLFPSSQYKLIQLLELNRQENYYEDFGNIHTYTTHSPYILSALNNLVYAYNVMEELNSQVESDTEINSAGRMVNGEKVRGIVRTAINPESFTAYELSDGTARSILDEKTRMVKENFIDQTADEINDDFQALTELLG